MFDIWKRNSMDLHALTNVVLSKAQEAALSDSIKQYAERSEVTVNGRSEARLVLPQVKYLYPAVPKKKGEQVKSLTKDSKAQNSIFLSHLRMRWVEKRDEVVAKAAKLSIALLDAFLKKEQSGQNPSERPSAAELKRRALQSLGIGKLNKWLEEDIEEAESKEKEDHESKRHEAAHAHDAFVRTKKALEVWMDPKGAKENVPHAPPRFVFAAGKHAGVPLRSKLVKVPSSTVDMMRGTGLKVVHALSAGKRRGREADLEKSRRQLEREGHLNRRNYSNEAEYSAAKEAQQMGSSLSLGERVRVKVGKDWVVATVERRTKTHFELAGDDNDAKTASGSEIKKRTGSAVGSSGCLEAGEEVFVEGAVWRVKRDRSTYLVAAQEGTFEVERDEMRRLSESETRQAAADESYSEWLEVKRARGQAREYLSLIQAPDELRDEETGALVDEPSALAHWKRVGRLLKAVDRGLMDDWFEWSKGFEVTNYICQVLWDAFEPIGDDVHQSHYSLAKTTLAKLLRPGLPFADAARKIMQRKWRSVNADGGEFADATAEEMAPFALFDRRDLKLLLKELGIALTEDQVRLVVDAFDDGEAGRMEVLRFLDFTGPNGPRAKTDAQVRLRRHTPPVWETTCPVTGLSNAFRVTAAPESAKDSDQDRRVKIMAKSNGEKRRQVELKERAKRIAILKHFDELRDDDDNDDDDYSDDDDDEDGGYSDDDDDDNGSAKDKNGKNKKKKKKCTMAQWLEGNGAILKAERKKALRTLVDLGRVRRDEVELQKLLEKGQPPAAPVFWSAGPSDAEVVACGDPLEESLLLCWDAAPKSFVAFFSVEMSGPRGSKEQRENVFQEICRDPDCAKGTFRYQTWVRNLEPGTSYTFRVRAFNGFGPGPYSWESFTTRPRRPNRPLVASKTQNSVSLRWGDDDAERWLRVIETSLASELPDLFATSTSGGNGVAAARAPGPLLLQALERSGAHGALEWLAATKRGRGVGDSSLSLLDVLDSDRGEGVSWPALKSLLLGAQGSKKARNKATSATELRFNVEQCVSIISGQWVKVLTTKFSHATVPALTPGTPYRFRVIAFNANNLESKKSPSVVATTLLETPPPPRVSPLRVEPGQCCLKLAWDPAAVFGMGLSQRDHKKQSIERILSSWTQEGADDEGAVSLAHAFRRLESYRNLNGDSEAYEVIALSDVEPLLTSLGLDGSDELKRAEVMASAEGDTISLEVLRQWWEGEHVVYEVRRDEGCPENGLSLSASETRPRVADTLCYRGSSKDGRSCVVAGLEPNFMYKFSLRLSTPRAVSTTSKYLEAQTPPAAVAPPVVVYSDSKKLALKWYPGRNGAHKYAIEAQLVETLDKGTAAAAEKLVAQGWRVMWSGKDNFTRLAATGGSAAWSGEGLLTNSVYRVRATAINTGGIAGCPSEPTLCRTSSNKPSASMPRLKPENAHEHFTVECRGDIVVGDTIVCTEQLFMGRDGKLAKPQATSTLKTIRFGLSSSVVAGSGTADRVYVGERTVAARVVKDTYRSAHHSAEMGIGRGSSGRRVRLEVIWSTVSCDEAGAFVLKAEDVIEREEATLAEYEVFRTPWREESRRLSEAKERVLCRKLVL